MKRVHQTNNLILRAWGNLCSYIGSWFLGQASQYGDLVHIDESFLSKINEIDDSFVWNEDDDV